MAHSAYKLGEILYTKVNNIKLHFWIASSWQTLHYEYIFNFQV